MRPITRSDWLSPTANKGNCMFVGMDGRLRPDAERIVDRASGLSDQEVERLTELEGVLRDVLNSFNARLEDLPERERKAMLYLLYQKVGETVFDFRLSLEMRFARERISCASSLGEKMAAIRAFHTIMKDVAELYGE